MTILNFGDFDVQKWPDWLIGFVEGDGCFHKNKNGNLSFQIYQKERAILEIIQNFFGFGKIYYHKTNKTYQFITGNEKNLRKIINLFNGNLRTINKHKQFATFVSAFNQKNLNPILLINKRKLVSLEDSWFSGFIDAEGSFFVSFSKKTYRFNFRFKVGQKGDNLLCLQLKQLFNDNKSCSVLYYKKHDFYQFQIDSLKGAYMIFSYLKNFPLKTKKSQSYFKWKKIHQKLLNKSHLQPQKRIKLIIEASKINH